ASLASGADGTPRRAQVEMRRNDANGYVVGIMAESVQAELHQQINSAAVEAYFESVYGSLERLRQGIGQADAGAKELSSGLHDQRLPGATDLADGLPKAALPGPRNSPAAWTMPSPVPTSSATAPPRWPTAPNRWPMWSTRWPTRWSR